MRRLALAVSLLLLGACATDATDSYTAATERGRGIAESSCAACHAIGRLGESTAPEAPPFRTLSRNYRVASLEEALAEGISVGHPAMPEFAFSPEDVDALILYLQSIQDAPDYAVAPQS